MGRRKIQIEPIADERNRTVTFVKRKAGLFKKAHELAVLCQVDLAVIIVGANSKVYEYSSTDTNELLGAYKRIDTKHETKGPEDFGGYKKTLRADTDVSGSMGYHDDDDSDVYDSSTPPMRKKRKREPDTDASARIVPSQGAPQVKVDHVAHQRPVLRVQIPSDVKNKANDSAKTITAIDVNQQETPENSNLAVSDTSDRNASENMTPSIRAKYLNSFNPSDSQKPTLPLPVQSKSLYSPSTATAPQLPGSSMPQGFYGPLPQPLPGGMATSSQPYQWQVPQGPSSGQQSPSGQTLPKAPNPAFNNYNKLRPLHGQQYPPHGQPSAAAGGPTPANPGEQTPQSGLPSRYVDLFPSPSNFYPPQDWPQTNMTPMANNMPHYFSMMPSGGSWQRHSQPGKLEHLPVYELYDKKKEG